MSSDRLRESRNQFSAALIDEEAAQLIRTEKHKEPAPEVKQSLTKNMTRKI